MTLDFMKKHLRESGMAFDDDEMPPGFWLNMNDVFDYATADAELVEDSDLPAVYALWQEYGVEGVMGWVARKRGILPLKLNRP